MPEIVVNKISIDFPYTPYECQIEYMKKVIQCLENRQNGLLESPTGTGKTLCLLCASLGWLQHHKAKISTSVSPNPQKDMLGTIDTNPNISFPKIIYSSRTHSQLNQVMHELKKTKYASLIHSSILASREQLCIHPQVSKESNNAIKIQKCRGKLFHHTCHFYNNVSNHFNTSRQTAPQKKPSMNQNNLVLQDIAILPPVPDIEDLVRFGTANKVCPYYSTRELAKNADLILTPYNYLVDAKSNGQVTGSRNLVNILKANKVNNAKSNFNNSADNAMLQDAILIFDEAHNLEKFCEEAASLEITSLEIARSLVEIDSAIDELRNRKGSGTHYQSYKELVSGQETPGSEFTLVELARVKECFLNLENLMDTFPLAPAQNFNASGSVLSIEYLADELLSRAFMMEDLRDARTFIELLERIACYVTQAADALGMLTSREIGRAPDVGGFEKMAVLVRTLFGLSSETSEGRNGEEMESIDNTGVPRKKSENDNANSQKNGLKTLLAKKFDIRVDRLAIMNNEYKNHYRDLKKMVKENMKNFKVHLRYDKNPPWVKLGGVSVPTVRPNTQRVLSLWCFSPSHTIKELFKKGIRCMILTSGTLSPISTFSSIMNVKFDVRLENEHIINADQVLVSALGKGPDGTALNSSYKNRSSTNYVSSLGLTILNLSRIIQGGILVFFPSYFQMDHCVQFWKKDSGIWTSLEKIKPVYIEPKTKDKLNQEISSYYDSIDGGDSISSVQDTKTNSAIMMGVCRGKLSEGFDFADSYARAVLICGLPYPARTDPKITLKIDFMNEKYRGNTERRSNDADGWDTMLDGNAWYRLEADRAVNQAVGRVIRHKADFGAILLCDERFCHANNKECGLSKWLSPRLKITPNFGQLISQIKRFFNAAFVNYPPALHTSHESGDDLMIPRRKKVKKLVSSKPPAMETTDWLGSYQKKSHYQKEPAFISIPNDDDSDVYFSATSGSSDSVIDIESIQSQYYTSYQENGWNSNENILNNVNQPPTTKGPEHSSQNSHSTQGPQMLLSLLNTLNQSQSSSKNSSCLTHSSSREDIMDMVSSISKISPETLLFPFKTSSTTKTDIRKIKSFKSLPHFLATCRKTLRAEPVKYFAFCDAMKLYSRNGNIRAFISSILETFERREENLRMVLFILDIIKVKDVKIYMEECLELYKSLMTISLNLTDIPVSYKYKDNPMNRYINNNNNVSLNAKIDSLSLGPTTASSQIITLPDLIDSSSQKEVTHHEISVTGERSNRSIPILTIHDTDSDKDISTADGVVDLADDPDEANWETESGNSGSTLLSSDIEFITGRDKGSTGTNSFKKSLDNFKNATKCKDLCPSVNPRPVLSAWTINNPSIAPDLMAKQKHQRKRAEYKDKKRQKLEKQISGQSSILSHFSKK